MHRYCLYLDRFSEFCKIILEKLEGLIEITFSIGKRFIMEAYFMTASGYFLYNVRLENT